MKVKINSILELRTEVGELYKLLNSIGAVECAVSMQEVDKLLSEEVDYRNIGGDVRFPEEWDYFTRLQSLVDDITYIRADIKTLCDSFTSNKVEYEADGKLKHILNILTSDDFIQELD